MTLAEEIRMIIDAYAPDWCRCPTSSVQRALDEHGAPCRGLMEYRARKSIATGELSALTVISLQ